jgi:hypothetical protein
VSSSHRALIVLGIVWSACSGGGQTHDANTARDHALIDGGRTSATDARAGNAVNADARAVGPHDAAATAPTTTQDARADPAVPDPRPTRLVLDFTTVTLAGKFAPRNVGAAWVADAQGKWVHTFELWSGPNFQVLAAYFAAGGPNYLPFLGSVTAPPDVVTRATQARHAPHPTETWNLLDASGNEVPDGNYSIMIEVAEQRPELVYMIPFMKTGEPAHWTPLDTGNLMNVSFRLE